MVQLKEKGTFLQFGTAIQRRRAKADGSGQSFLEHPGVSYGAATAWGTGFKPGCSDNGDNCSIQML